MTEKEKNELIAAILIFCLEDARKFPEIAELTDHDEYDVRQIVRALRQTGMLFGRNTTHPYYLTTERGKKFIPSYQAAT